MADSMIQTVARVGKVLGLDPVTILSDNGEPLLVDIRIACARIVQDDERKQEEQQKRARGSGGGSRPRRGGRGRRR